MRFDFSAFATGVLGAFSMFVAIAVASDYHGIGSAEWCAPDESILVCIRQWSQVIAVAAAFVTVLVISNQVRVSERHHRQAADIQTFPLRARFARLLTERVGPLENKAEVIGLLAELCRNQPPPIYDMYRAIEDAEGMIADVAKAAHEYDDGTIFVGKKRALGQLKLAFSHVKGLPALTTEDAAEIDKVVGECGDAARAIRDFCELVRSRFPKSEVIPTVAQEGRHSSDLFRQFDS